jgi:hypothetical protein
MANVLTANIWTCTELGILTTKPVWVKGIMFYPAAVSNAFVLKWWDEADTTLRSGICTYTIDLVSADHHVKATSNVFPSTWLDGNVVKCLETTGSDEGKYGLIKTAGDNDEFTVHLIPLTAEATKVGDWACYPSYYAFMGLQPTVTNSHQCMWFPFGGERGFRFPNLALDILSSSAYLQIYLG